MFVNYGGCAVYTQKDAGFYQEFTESGTVVLDPMPYIFTLVGGGAGGIGGAVAPLSQSGRACVVQGGVGGVLVCKITLLARTTLTLTIGKGGGASGFQATGTGTGLPGEATKISGLQGNLVAGGGTAPSIRIFRGNFTPTPGVQGTNSYFAGATVIENNKKAITSSSHEGKIYESSYPPQLLLNSNYVPDTTKGAAGCNGWLNTGALQTLAGQPGIIVIESA